MNRKRPIRPVIPVLALCSVLAASLLQAQPVWEMSLVDSGGGTLPSLALDAAGNPHILYTDAFLPRLKYGRWNGDQWLVQSIKFPGFSSFYTCESLDMDIDSSGLPHILFVVTNSSFPRGVYYGTFDGAGWECAMIDPMGMMTNSQIFLDADDNPHVLYNDGRFIYARRDGAGWIKKVICDDSGVNHSLAVDSSSRPHIAFGGDDGWLYYATWNGSEWETSAIEEIGLSWTFNDIAICADKQDDVHVAYVDRNDFQMRYARREGLSWLIDMSLPAIPGTDRFHVSMDLNGSGHPRISYLTESSGSREIRHCYWDGESWLDEFITAGDESSVSADAGGNMHAAVTNAGYSVGSGLWYGWKENPGVPTVPAVVDFKPDGLNLKSGRKMLTCFIELPPEYSVRDIETATVAITRIGDTDILLPARTDPSNVGDYDSDGCEDLMVKFDYEKVGEVLQGMKGEVAIQVTGCVQEAEFSGEDTVAIATKSVKSIPAGGQAVLAGPETYGISMNYPNPFNASTVITYSLPGASDVTIEVLNIRGLAIRTLEGGRKEAGAHFTTWDGKDASGARVPTGYYFCRIRSDFGPVFLRMLLLQ